MIERSLAVVPAFVATMVAVLSVGPTSEARYDKGTRVDAPVGAGPEPIDIIAGPAGSHRGAEVIWP